MSESEALEAGMSLPADARRRLAIRLLESIEATGQEAIDEARTSEIWSRIDDILSGRVQTIPGEEVFARIGQRLDARNA
ncbi:addiction module protein [Nocardioides sp. SYSU DS0651]|uniref:addiction module protein n=1 Tax=Nocardioides sp. SYSU DS0651 TaxID=3415955 RepID=UPI003F4B2C3F